MSTLAIIGTAGRKDDAARLTTQHWVNMCDNASLLIQRLNITHLISGGAAWADHVAVEMCEALELTTTIYGPCHWDVDNSRWMDTGVFDWATNPGGTANYYHRKFSKTIGELSLEQIAANILHARMEILPGAGFKERNSAIAERADVLLAFTFGAGGCVKDGGTRDTFLKFRALKPKALAIHVDLEKNTAYHAY